MLDVQLSHARSMYYHWEESGGIRNTLLEPQRRTRANALEQTVQQVCSGSTFTRNAPAVGAGGDPGVVDPFREFHAKRTR